MKQTFEAGEITVWNEVLCVKIDVLNGQAAFRTTLKICGRSFTLTDASLDGLKKTIKRYIKKYQMKVEIPFEHLHYFEGKIKSRRGTTVDTHVNGSEIYVVWEGQEKRESWATHDLVYPHLTVEQRDYFSKAILDKIDSEKRVRDFRVAYGFSPRHKIHEMREEAAKTAEDEEKKVS